MTHVPGIPVDGTVQKNEHKSEYPCSTCKGTEVYYRIWESSCGGWEDDKYECKTCGARWWVDGIDS